MTENEDPLSRQLYMIREAVAFFVGNQSFPPHERWQDWAEAMTDIEKELTRLRTENQRLRNRVAQDERLLQARGRPT